MIELSTEGFDLTLNPLRDASGYFDGEGRLTCGVGAVVHSFTTLSYFPLSDFARLCAWADEHVQALLETRTKVSEVWVPLDLSMSIQFQLGEIYHQHGSLAGGFSMIVFLNIGRDKSSRRVYGGFEAEVDIAEMSAFCTALRQYSGL
ncbi:MAG TPA: hypothetical protein VN837_08500 [Chloroflexota bacterium]|nr:hypothetical protein [Chloroflexota bacterium]